MILWVNPRGPLAYHTIDDAIDDACPGDHILVFGIFGIHDFTGVPKGLDPLVIEAPEGAEIPLKDAVLVESHTTFINMDFYCYGNAEAGLYHTKDDPGYVMVDCRVDFNDSDEGCPW